jgi:signal transduction histidine kinase
MIPMSDVRRIGKRTLAAMATRSILLVLLYLLCLLPAIHNNGLPWSGVGLSCLSLLITGLAVERWIARIRRDVQETQQKNVQLSEELRQAIEDLNHARSSFEEKQTADRASLLRVRHDLIGPIGSITGFVQLLRDGGHSLSPRQLGFVENIERSVGNLLRVIGPMADEQDPPEPLKKPVVSCQSINPADEPRHVRTWIKTDSWSPR